MEEMCKVKPTNNAGVLCFLLLAKATQTHAKSFNDLFCAVLLSLRVPCNVYIKNEIKESCIVLSCSSTYTLRFGINASS